MREHLRTYKDDVANFSSSSSIFIHSLHQALQLLYAFYP
ncbi:MAG: palindromic element RPE5 domain-containing protein [Rickettsia endosymbiont of Glossina mortisans submortisans]|nr:palindromic element RPE5 domain-containing protein [Rickettsia endosymbiont of Glossina mortisans submortisans]